MRKTSFRVIALLSVIVIVAGTGCIHKASGPVTPWERVTTENAILAQTLNTATQGTIAVQVSGLISVQEAAPVLQYEAQVAQIQKQLTAILALAPDAKNIPAIQALINQISAGANALVGSGALGIKNPKSQQTIGADIQAVVNSATLILNAYVSATGGTS